MSNGDSQPVSQGLDDLELVKLLAKYDRQILRYIMMFLPRHGDAEEVLQRTAVVLWEKSKEFDRQREFLPWALHRAYYEVLNFRKEAARSKLVFSEELMQLLDDERREQQSYLDEMKEALQHCLSKVSETDLKILQFRYAEAKSISELSEEVGRTAKSLYRRLDRIRELLSNCVQQRLNTLDLN